MTAGFKKLLLCTNGAEVNLPALEYGVWLAGRLDLEVSLLGIIERPGMSAAPRAVIARVMEMLEVEGRVYQVLERVGNSKQVIPQENREADYLTILGPLGRRSWVRWVRGRSFRRVQEKVSTPMIYTRTAHLQMTHILVCMGGLGYAQGLLDMSLLLARQMGASITILHVVEPITYVYPTAHEVGSNWEAILKTDTPQGRNLSEAFRKAQQAGVEVEIKIRNGNPVHEIIAETCTAPYDLVGMGSPYSAKSLRRLFAPNVTAEVADNIDFPILTM